jgi:predicted MPP superfamily phosphohydrolase
MTLARAKHNSRVRRVAMAALDRLLLHGRVAGWTYRCGLHGTLRVTSYEVEDSRLPAPLVLAFASDFHAGPTTHVKVFDTLVHEIKATRPDVILLGGDYVFCKAEYVDVVCQSLSQCDPPLGIYAVLGNHDLWADEEHITRQLAMCGVRVLVNENVSLPSPFDCVSICGIDDPWTGNADVSQAFKGSSSVRIFLAHAPEALLLFDKEQFEVGFAGHTHGGQIALPDGTQIVSAGGPLSRLYGRGRFDVPGRGPLIVSRGVGCSSIPVRINSDPELVVCTLRPQFA